MPRRAENRDCRRVSFRLPDPEKLRLVRAAKARAEHRYDAGGSNKFRKPILLPPTRGDNERNAVDHRPSRLI
jgi:hypothetical protein